MYANQFFQDIYYPVVYSLSKRKHHTKSMSNQNLFAGSDLPPSKKHCSDASIFQDSLSVAAKFGYKDEFLSFFTKGMEVHVGERKNPDCGHN